MDETILEKICNPLIDVVDKLANMGLEWEDVGPMLENMKAVSEGSKEMSDF